MQCWGLSVAGKSPPGSQRNFLAHNTETKSLRANNSNICAKIIKTLFSSVLYGGNPQSRGCSAGQFFAENASADWPSVLWEEVPPAEYREVYVMTDFCRGCFCWLHLLLGVWRGLCPSVLCGGWLPQCRGWSMGLFFVENASAEWPSPWSLCSLVSLFSGGSLRGYPCLVQGVCRKLFLLSD